MEEETVFIFRMPEGTTIEDLCKLQRELRQDVTGNASIALPAGPVKIILQGDPQEGPGVVSFLNRYGISRISEVRR